MILENRAEFHKAAGLKLGGVGAELGGGAVKQAWDATMLIRDAGSGNYLKLVSTFSKELAKALENSLPKGSVRDNAKIARPITDKLLVGGELLMLTIQHEELLAQRERIFEQLLKETVRDPASRASWDEFTRNRQKSLEAYRSLMRSIEQREVLAKRMLEDAGPGGAFNVGRGIVIVDPQDELFGIRKIPGLDPAFIRALNAQAEALLRGDVDTAARAGKSSDGRYLPAFTDRKGDTLTELGDSCKRLEEERYATSAELNESARILGRCQKVCFGLESHISPCLARCEDEAMERRRVGMKKHDDLLARRDACYKELKAIRGW